MKPVALAVLAAFSWNLTVAADDGTESGDAKAHASTLAVKTLSEQQEVDAASIDVINVAIMDWPDSSLGCPQAGMEYTQMVTRGAHVLLKIDTKIYRVHTAGERAIICAGPSKIGGGAGGSQFAGGGMQEVMTASRQDLAARLGTDVTDVTISKIESITWPDTALGCPVQGVEYTPGEIKGYRLTLNEGGRKFVYHTDQEKGFPCPAISND